MRRGTPPLRDVARLLLQHETGNRSGSEALEGAVDGTFQVLRDYLTARFGAVGFRTLLDCALSVTKAEYPQLARAKLETDGKLSGLGEVIWMGEAAALDAVTAWLANLLELLASFIGEDLTVRLVRSAWPDLPLCDGDLDNRGREGAV